jgi:PhzF family phenazine biosynthesis protein
MQINAFTDKPFGGNPAAVCYLPMMRDDQWLQSVATQFNLSETAFLIQRTTAKRKSAVFKKKPEDSQGADEFDLRWFTPKVEVKRFSFIPY